MVSIVRWMAWALTGVGALALVTQPVSVQTQLSLSVAIIMAMVGFWMFGRGRWVRQVVLALGSMVVLRYVYWRTTQTLPPWSEFIDFLPGVILYVAEMYCFLILAISLIINVDPLVRPRLERSPDEDLPTVDVFIPTYNEDEYILATTMAAALSMDYPAHKLKVWLCDDGGTDQKCNDKDPVKAAAARKRRADLQKLCADLGGHYHTRAKNEHAKAGNMNACLKDSDGDLIVVFDADHAPFRMFLRETVGHFLKDERLFLVQTPHVFLNPDPIEKNLQTFQTMPSENEMFYSITQRGLDKWDGSFFCGSAALLRRKALEETNGFSGITITEDCETAFELHASGWHSAYVDKPLIAGLQPETFTSFIGQRSRWCQGMFQIMILKNPVLKKGLKFIQRIAYMSSMTFWFFPVPRLIFMFAPLLYIFFDVKLFVANVDETIAYTLMYLIVNLIIQNYMYGRVRWPWVSEVYEYTQGVFLIKAMITVFLNPRKPTFNVTAKGLSLEEDHLSELSWPFFVIYGLLAAGGVTAALRYAFEPGVNALMLVVCLWNTFNMIIAGAALGAVAERKQPDRHPRLTIERKGVLVCGGARHLVDVADVSAGGCAITTHEDLEHELGFTRDMKMRLEVVPLEDRPLRASLPLLFRLANTQNGVHRYAFEFGDLVSTEYFALAELMYGDSEALPRFLETRHAHKDIFRGTLQLIRWGLLEPPRSFSYLAIEMAARKRAKEAAKAEPAPPQTAPRPIAAPAPAAVAAPVTPSALLAAPVHAAPANVEEHELVAQAVGHDVAGPRHAGHYAAQAGVQAGVHAGMHAAGAPSEAPSAAVMAAAPPQAPAAASARGAHASIPKAAVSNAPMQVAHMTSAPPATPATPTLRAPLPEASASSPAAADPLAELLAALSEKTHGADAAQAGPEAANETEDEPIANLRRLLETARRSRSTAA